MSHTTEVGALGLDKLQFMLSASQVEFSPAFECDLHYPRVNSATGETGRCFDLYRTTSGAVMRGMRASLNTENWQVTIEPDLETGAGLFFLQASGKLYEETNLNPLIREDVRNKFPHVQDELKKLGATFQLDKALITRMDVTRNIQMAEPISSYAPLFSAVGGNPRDDKQDFGGTGFLVGNGSWQIALYDKGAQMRALGYERSLRPVNMLRPELRCPKARTSRDRFGFATPNLPEVLDGWSNLELGYKAALKKKVLCWREEVAKPLPSNLDAMAASASESRNPTRSLMEELGYFTLVKAKGLPSAKQYLRDMMPVDAKNERARNKKLDAIAQRLALDGVAPSGRALRELYRELESKLLDA